MKSEHEHITAIMVQEFFNRNRGKRFHSGQIAAVFGVGTASMRNALETMTIQQLIRRSVDGKRSVYYVPDQEQLDAEAHALRARPFKQLSVSYLIDRDYDARRPGSGDLLKVPSKFSD